MGETKTLHRAGHGAKRMGQNCPAHFTEVELGVTVGSCGRLGEKRGKEGGRLVINICELIMIMYAKEKTSVLESERPEFAVIS